MNILFIHRHMPAQFVHLAPALAARGGNRVVFLTQDAAAPPAGVEAVRYQPRRAPNPAIHNYLAAFEAAVLNGQAVARALLSLRQQGFVPDLVIAHPGWGEALYVKDVVPTAKLALYGEFYYRGSGADLDFDPDDPPSIDAICRTRSRNAHLLLSLESADLAWSPTEWQRSLHPEPWRARMPVVFDGIDTRHVAPDSAAVFALPDGRMVDRRDEIVTYVARDLEPYRGFPQFLRALPRLLELRPGAQVVIAGGDGLSYSQRAPGGLSWRDYMLREVPLDPARVHFTGVLPYDNYLALLQVSAVHVYLTVPFVLSWSMLEAMAAGCLLVGSDTPPVREVVADGMNGFLVPFFDADVLAERIAERLADRHADGAIRAAARATVEQRYAVATCVPRLVAMLDRLMA